jgi:hypothetical protein
MTLVVARKQGNDICIVADCLISGGPATRIPEYALKILAISPRTMVAYTGSPELAHRLIKEAMVESAHQIDRFVEALNTFRQALGDAELDFIVINEDEIVQLKDGTLDGNLSGAWIGNTAAFGLFQSAFHKEDAKFPVGTRMRTAMEMVCNLREIESVGGPVVAAESAATGLRYTGFLQLVSPYYVPRADLNWQTVDFGTAATGGFGFTTIVPPKPGLCGWGIFYFQSGIGFYFCVDLLMMKFEILRGYAPNAEEFCSLLEPEVGYLPVFVGQLG